METINTEAETAVSGYEYTHADGTVQRVESADTAIKVCPVLGKMAVEQANLLLELSALGQGIIDQQKEQQTNTVDDTFIENQPTAGPSHGSKTTAITVESMKQTESHFYSDSGASGYMLSSPKSEQTLKTETSITGTAQPIEKPPAVTVSYGVEILNRSNREITDKPVEKPKPTKYEIIPKIEKTDDESSQRSKTETPIESSVNPYDLKPLEDEPYVQDLIPIPLEVPVEEITDTVEDSQKTTVIPTAQEIIPQKIEEAIDNKLDFDSVAEVTAPIAAKPNKVSPLQDIAHGEPPDEANEYTEIKPITETVIEKITELASGQIDPENVLNSTSITDVIEVVQNLREQIQTGVEGEEIEQTKAELAAKLVTLFEELGIEIESEEIEKLVDYITENAPSPTELSEYLPIDDIDIEHSGTHEIKRSLSKFLSDSVNTAECDIKQFIGKIILRHITAES